MTSFLAQCPHCMTSFRVSEPQLEAAGGMVRCGACLGVFSAPANRITVKQAMTPEQWDAALADSIPTVDDDIAVPAPAVSETYVPLELDYKVTLAYGSTSLPAPPLPPPPMHVPTVAAPPQSPYRDKVPDLEMPRPAQTVTVADEPDGADGDRAPDIRLGDMDLDIDDAAQTAAPGAIRAERRRTDESVARSSGGRAVADDVIRADRRKPHSGIQAPAVFADSVKPVNTRLPPGRDMPAHYSDLSMSVDIAARLDPDPGEDFLPDYDDLAFSALSDDVGARASTTNVRIERKAIRKHKVSDATDADAKRIRARTASSRPAADDDKEALREYLAALEDDEALEPLERSFDLDAIDAEPVTIQSAKIARRRRLNAAAAVLSLLLVLQLGLFVVDRNLDTLVEDPRFAPLLPLACIILECPVPEPRSDLSSLYSQELLIRSHPRYDSALEVSFIFRNDAAMAQPFPAIELGFSDTRNRMLVNRLFQPDEYLPPELRDLPEMPAQTSLQISLELADPGSEAVNYTLAFREP